VYGILAHAKLRFLRPARVWLGAGLVCTLCRIQKAFKWALGTTCGRKLNLDSTWGTTKEGFELCTVIGSRCGIKGAPIASIYVGDMSSATVQRALQWVTDVMARHKVLLHPEVVIADDDKGERKAIKLTWPKAQLRLCIWHILERGLGSKLEPLVGAGPTTAFKLEVWATARGWEISSRMRLEFVMAGIRAFSEGFRVSAIFLFYRSFSYFFAFFRPHISAGDKSKKAPGRHQRPCLPHGLIACQPLSV